MTPRAAVSILENELVRKYFGDHDSRSQERRSNWAMAYKVLTAMEEPINKGERYLWLGRNGEVEEKTNSWGDRLESTVENGIFHGLELRLPSQFQPRQEPECCTWIGRCKKCGRDKYVEDQKTTQPPSDKCPHGQSFCVECRTEGKWQIKDSPATSEKCDHRNLEGAQHCLKCNPGPSEKCDGECGKECKVCWPVCRPSPEFPPGVESCDVCGGKKVLIRGKHPSDDNRWVCAICLAERMDNIREVADPYYGLAQKSRGEA